MINTALLSPRSIVVLGGSDDVYKPGGAVLRNLLGSPFRGEVYVVNPKADTVQGIRSYHTVEELPQVDCAIVAIAAKFCVEAVRVLTREKGTRGFIVLSAGFGEESREGAELEREMVALIDAVGGSLIGPNCTGLLTTNYNGAFTSPVPQLAADGVDLISGSGATAIFIVDNGMRKGLRFSSCWAVGNSAQIGVEEVLEHLDETFDVATSSRIKLLYVESITKPQKFLKHASSLVRKGCRVAAVKSGGSEAGSRAASSHTGALASPDKAVEALFRKAGIVRCSGRDELTTVAAIFSYPPMQGRRMAIVTHAGGPAVMLTDALSNGGMEVPHIDGERADELLKKLFGGSSVGNPIDFLATGTAEQLGEIVDACERDFDNVDGVAVIFGSPGLAPVGDAYDAILSRLRSSAKPVFPILPSYIYVQSEVDEFVRRGGVYFPDEVLFGNALCKVAQTPAPQPAEIELPTVDEARIRAVIDNAAEGYLAPEKVAELLDAAGIGRAQEVVVDKVEDAVRAAEKTGFPLVMKVVGPLHKSDVGGVRVGIKDLETVRSEFGRMMRIADTYAVMLAEQLAGTELFVGAKREGAFGHTVLCGLGGIFVEALKDVATGLAPLSANEALGMIASLRGRRILEGARGTEPVNLPLYAEIVSRVSALVTIAPEISEMDINPLLGNARTIKAVDARIKIER